MSIWVLMIWMGHATLQVWGFESAKACDDARLDWVVRLKPGTKTSTYTWRCSLVTEERK